MNAVQAIKDSAKLLHGEQCYIGTRYSTKDSTEAHIERYEFAKRFVSGKILDASCGSGYGTAILGSECIGIDYQDDALSYCRQHYPNTFLKADLNQTLPFASDSFDGIVSLETLEHIANQDTMLSEFKRVLKTGGTLVISAPNKELSKGDNHFHVGELTKEQFIEKIGRYFTLVDFYGQAPLKELPFFVRTIKPVIRPVYVLFKAMFGTFGESVAREFRPFTLHVIEKAQPDIRYHGLIGVYKKL